jgi:hypothetical protein
MLNVNWGESRKAQIFAAVGTTTLGFLTIITSIIISSRKSLAPSLPKAVSPNCTSTITIAAPTPTPTPTPTLVPTPTPTPTPTATPTPLPGCTYEYVNQFTDAAANNFEGETMDSNDNVYLTDSTTGVVYKFSSEGNLLGKWGSAGSGDNQFTNPTGLAYNSADGYLYVADRGNKRIQVVNSVDGSFIRRWTLSDYPYDVAVNPVNHHVYVSENYTLYDIKEFDNYGNQLGVYQGGSSPNNWVPQGLIFDTSGNLYFVDGNTWNSRTIKKINYGSSAASVFASQSCASPRANFNYLWYLGSDASNNIYVPESYSGGIARVNVYLPDGQCNTVIGIYGTDPEPNGEVGIPTEEATIDSRGYVFISTKNTLVKIFRCPTQIPSGQKVSQVASTVTVGATVTPSVYSLRLFRFVFRQSYYANFAWVNPANSQNIITNYQILKSRLDASGRVVSTSTINVKPQSAGSNQSYNDSISRGVTYQYKFCVLAKTGEQSCSQAFNVVGGTTSPVVNTSVTFNVQVLGAVFAPGLLQRLFLGY